MDTAAANLDDNLFAGPKLQPARKVLICMPTDEWLCKKLSNLTVTLVEGYPSCSSSLKGCRYCLYSTSILSDLSGEPQNVGKIESSVICNQVA